MDNNCADFDWGDFVERLFRQPPADPFTFYLSFLDEIDERKLANLLGQMLINGVKFKYHKEIARLSPNEIEEVKKYYHSFGYDITYQIEVVQGAVPINKFNIDFKPYPHLFDAYNKPGSDIGVSVPYL
jgi:hypothetical protein